MIQKRSSITQFQPTPAREQGQLLDSSGQVLDRAHDTSAVDGTRRPPKVAYIMSRFPKITETFVLYEMIAVEKAGIQVEVYPLLREQTSVMHPEAVAYVERAHFQSFVSWPILLAHLYYLLRKPRAYGGALWTLLRATWGSRRFFIGGLGIFPKAVYFARQMSDTDITHIHAHFASHPAAAAFIVHRLTGIPYSFTAHGSDLHRERRMLCEKVTEAKFVVPISAYNAQIIRDECQCAQHDKLDAPIQTQLNAKINIIHCGVDTDTFVPRSYNTSAPDTTGVSDNDGASDNNGMTRPLTILCIGTLHEVKGQTYLIDACRLLQERGIDFTCCFVGDGPDCDARQAQVAEAGLTTYVQFLGRQTQGDVARLLQAADVVVAPSVPSRDGRREGIPMVLMEAMASGLPVVSSRLSGIPELVEHDKSGLLTDPGDVVALTDALQQLAASPTLRQRLGMAGREKVVHDFDLHTNAAVLAEFFAEKLQSGKSDTEKFDLGVA